MISESECRERLTMIRGRCLRNTFPDENNKDYKTYNLKYKLVKYFQQKMKFWSPQSSKTTSDLVYSA